ncbi:uncharacterized protein CLUP02_09333 [Colletotrichum lupini]|uniref:Uncharacterized protein n=1 Tax=Colletotrichum lupini TaxID=145971 RepID=A0A9Q8SWD7_9PEZI|nr:uncharacterized protein CLUP02_09333 [Colletotrichum lupini]UQC83837.1 hypothetical protein CLUP02_09333 [Colletotrichum lupini]
MFLGTNLHDCVLVFSRVSLVPTIRAHLVNADTHVLRQIAETIGDVLEKRKELRFDKILQEPLSCLKVTGFQEYLIKKHFRQGFKTYSPMSDIEASIFVKRLSNSLEYDLKRRMSAIELTKFARFKSSDPSRMRKQVQSSWL